MRLIDAANSIYEFGDPAFGFSAWSALRDKGREGTFTTLAWQGSIAATLAALQAAVAERGGGVVAPSIACAKWWTQPSGPLTADFIGSAGSGGSMQAAAIADALSQSVAGPAVAGLAAANALRPGTAGLHVGGENESFAQAIDRLLLGVSLLWLPRPDGTIAIREWAFNDAAPVLNGIFKGRSRTYPPHGKRRLGFQRNERIHNDSEIAGILLEEITDGDSLLAREDLLNSEQQWGDVQDQLGTRPEDNATNGAQAGVNITDESGELLSDVDIVTADDPKLQGIDEGARRDANMVPNGDLAEPGSEMFLFQTRTSRVKGVASDPVASFLRFDAGGNAQMWFGVGVSTNAGNSNAVIPINPGDKLFVRFLARKNAGSTAQLQWAFFVYDGAKNYGGGFNSGYFDFGSGWEYRTGVIEVPATGSNGNPVAYIKFQLKKVGATNQVDVAGAWLTKFERGATVGATAGTNLRQSGGQVLTDAEIRNTDLRVSAQPGGEFYLTRTGNVAIDNFNLSEAGIDALAYLPAVDLGTSQAVGTLPVERAAAELRNSELQLTKTGTTFNLAGGGASDALDIAALGFVGDLNATAGADFGANVANIPAELVDGRIPAGLAANGDVSRPVPIAQVPGGALNSNLQLVKTGTTFNLAGGGASDALDIGSLGFVGDLDATAGADLATNVANATADNIAETGLRMWAAESGADITANAQVVISPPGPQIIYRDYQGNPKAGQFDRVLTPVVQRGGVDIRTDNSVDYAITTSGVTATVNDTDGHSDKGRITATAGGPGSISLTVTVDGKAYGPFPIAFNVQDDAPPVSGGGSTGGGSDSTLQSVNSTAFSQMTNQDAGETIFTVTISGAGDTINGTAPLTYNWTHNANGTNKLKGYWGYRVAGGGGAFTAFAATITGSPATWLQVDLSGEPGSININQSVTGLAAGSYEVALLGAKDTALGNAITIQSGTATVSVS